MTAAITPGRDELLALAIEHLRGTEPKAPRCKT
jgi:hypothetical protein